jgi:REP element-mobilizing transposase RayT
MSTPPRYFQQNIPYHVYNRGNRKSEIFLDTKDYQRFLKRMNEYRKQFDISILCYCLMPNHFHFLLKSNTHIGISNFMLRLCTSYAKYFNIKYNLVGRLFQERFRAKIVDTDEYLLHLSRYIHLNPISEDLKVLTSQNLSPAVIRSQLRSYAWSSYHDYLQGNSNICALNQISAYFSKTHKQLSYQTFVEASIPNDASTILSSFV